MNEEQCRNWLAEALRVLENLHAVQNGPPLITEQTEWEEAIYETELFMAALRAQISKE